MGRKALLLTILAALVMLLIYVEGQNTRDEPVWVKDLPGRWNTARTNPPRNPLTDEQRKQIDALQSIGYVSGSELAGSYFGVQIYDREHAFHGLNLYTSGHAPEAILMDMDGRVLYRWEKAYEEVWPDQILPIEENQEFWRRARLLDDGSMLAIFEGRGIVKLDRYSNVVWSSHNGAHHDLEVQSNGEILHLAREARMIPRVSKQAPVLEDFVIRLDSAGQEIERVSLLESFERSQYRWIWDQADEKTGDSFHTNSIELIAADGLFEQGQVLVSIRHLDTIAVIDLEDQVVTWAQQGPFDAQHEATVVPEGIMLFNNLLSDSQSAVQIFDPKTGDEVWVFAGNDQTPLFTSTSGSSQPLPNGNILITESNNGRAIEIDSDGNVVWEFLSPHRAGNEEQYVATLFELLRLPPKTNLDWLESRR